MITLLYLFVCLLLDYVKGERGEGNKNNHVRFETQDTYVHNCFLPIKSSEIK